MYFRYLLKFQFIDQTSGKIRDFIRKHALRAIFAVCVNNGTNFMTQFTARDRTSVTVAISAGKMPAADVAEQTMDNLRAQSGARFEPLKEEYGVLSARYEIHGGAGVYFFGADGEQVAVINILGSDPEEGIKFLRRFVPRTEKLFPKF